MKKSFSLFRQLLTTAFSSKIFELTLNSLYFGIGDLLQKFLSIFLLPIYTRYLVPEDYGIIALLGILTMVVSALTMCGLTNGISRYFYYSENQGVSRDEVVWSPLLFVIGVTAMVVTSLIYFSGHLSELLFDTANYEYLIILTLINIFISNISDIGRALLIFEERVWTVNAINIIGIVVGATAGITLVVLLDRGVMGVVEAGLFGSAFMGILTYLFSLRRYVLRFNYGILKKQLSFSLPLVVAIFAFFFIDASDRYLLKLFLPLSEVGLYNIGYQVGMLMMLFVGGFTSAWPPYYHRHNQNGEGQSICERVLHMYLLGAAIFSVFISLVSPMALRFLTTDAYYEAYSVSPFVALAYMLKGPYIIFLMGVLQKNKTSWQVYLEGFAAVLNIALNILLIPSIGREAAAITTLLSYAVMVVGSYFMVQRVNPIPGFSSSKTFAIILLAVVFSIIILIPGYMSVYIWASPLVFLIFMFTLFYLYRRDLQIAVSALR